MHSGPYGLFDGESGVALRARFVGQPFEDLPNLHDFLSSVLESTDLDRLTVLTAWGRRSGLGRIASELHDFHVRGGSSRIILGIDEGGATEQGLALAMGLFHTAFVFHDPTSRTFHPKLYLAKGPDRAEVLTGSNNMTAGGVYYNYEAASHLYLDRSDEDDNEYLSEVEAYVDSLLNEDELCHELDADLFDYLLEHRDLYRIRDEDASWRTHADDESDAPEHGGDQQRKQRGTSPFGGASAARRADPQPPSRTGTSTRNRSTTRGDGTSEGRRPTAEDSSPDVATPGAPTVSKRWFKQLGKIDAQQPDSPDGHPSNTMTLVAAGHPINTQHYFREEFFADGNWMAAESRGGKDREVTTIECEVFVDGSSQGVREFEIRHTPAYDSDQSNRATELAWGDFGLYMRSNSHVGDYATLEKLMDGTYRLHLESRPTGSFIP